MVSMKDRPRQPVPEEDIYSITRSGPSSNVYSGSSGRDNTNKKDKPPKLPPRDVKNGSKVIIKNPKILLILFSIQFQSKKVNSRFSPV